MANQRFLLDPNQTAMENLFRAADYATRYILGRKRIRLKTTEEWDELHAMCVYKSVSIFLRRYIGDHQYNRKYSFYENVHSAVWSCITPVVTCFFRDIKRRLNSTDHMATLEYDPDRHALNPPKTNWSPVLTAAERESLEISQIRTFNAEEALNYLWACEDEAAAYEHRVIDHAANLEHRKHVLERIKAKENDVDPQRLKQRQYEREYRRKIRAAAARR